MMCSEAAWWRCHRRLVLDNRVAISPDDAQKIRGASPMHADFIANLPIGARRPGVDGPAYKE
jgi:hypothetical protein